MNLTKLDLIANVNERASCDIAGWLSAPVRVGNDVVAFRTYRSGRREIGFYSASPIVEYDASTGIIKTLNSVYRLPDRRDAAG
jgi:hypothetical protein